MNGTHLVLIYAIDAKLAGVNIRAMGENSGVFKMFCEGIGLT